MWVSFRQDGTFSLEPFVAAGGDPWVDGPTALEVLNGWLPADRQVPQSTWYRWLAEERQGIQFNVRREGRFSFYKVRVASLRAVFDQLMAG